MSGIDLSRRRLLWGLGASSLVGVTALAPFDASARHAPSAGPAPQGLLEPALQVQPLTRENALDWKEVLLAGDRSLRMRRDGTVATVRYARRDGSLDLNCYIVACHLLRDVRADKTVQIDPELLDVLCGIQRWMEFNGSPSTIEITSGFRTARTNDAAEGSRRHSMHLYGKAADIIVPGASSALIGDMVRRFNHEGGTGIYSDRGFVHVDTGSARSWVAGHPRPIRHASRQRRGR
jgi:uncharacterized protein YcbK (DUF882 family)